MTVTSKELLSHFFLEFIDLFLPDVAAYLDRDFAIAALDKEVFTDYIHRDRHEVDLLMRVKFRGKDAFFLIHIENQATAQSDFPRRMFGYFSRLTEKYNLPVYPVVIFSYDAPARAEPKQYSVSFPDKTVLRFDYTVIQLNRLPWRRFVRSDNPVASALMAKMKMSPKDRPKVRLECLRLLASLKLDPARSKLIGGFIDSYLTLSAEEMKRYERQMAALAPVERDTTMALVSSWEQKGIERGEHNGKEKLLTIILRKRFSTLPEDITHRLDQLTAEQMDELGEALFTFSSLSDLQRWLEQR